MTQFYVAAVRDWDESRMEQAFDHATELGSEKSFMTSDYKTVRTLVRYRLPNQFNYHNHVWAVWRCRPMQSDVFLGLEYNNYDTGLCELAKRYMTVRNRLHRNPTRHSAYPLSIRTS